MNPNLEAFNEAYDKLFDTIEVDVYLDLNRKERRKFLKSVKTKASKLSKSVINDKNWSVGMSDNIYANVMLNNMTYSKKVFKDDLLAKEIDEAAEVLNVAFSKYNNSDAYLMHNESKEDNND